jgi:hypothetical protein
LALVRAAPIDRSCGQKVQGLIQATSSASEFDSLEFIISAEEALPALIACLHIARVEGIVAAVNDGFDIAIVIRRASHIWKRC